MIHAHLIVSLMQNKYVLHIFRVFEYISYILQRLILQSVSIPEESIHPTAPISSEVASIKYFPYEDADFNLSITGPTIKFYLLISSALRHKTSPIDGVSFYCLFPIFKYICYRYQFILYQQIRSHQYLFLFYPRMEQLQYWKIPIFEQSIEPIYEVNQIFSYNPLDFC